MRVLDPVVRELLWNGFEALVDEMSLILQRSAFSPMIREMLDFSCGFLDAKGRIIADSHLIPAQAGTLEFALQGALQRTGPLKDGDVLITNDPYQGATHLPDIEVFAPVYVGESLIGYVATVAHHVDIGGLAAQNRGALPGAAPANRDLFEEGLQIPPVRLYEEGVRNEALWQLLLRNVRDPRAVEGDITAQLSSCRRGIERLKLLASRYSASTLTAAANDLIDDTAARAATLLRSWGDRETSVVGWLDGDGLHYDAPLRVAARVAVREGRLRVDLTGSADQTTGTFNVPVSSTWSALYYALRCFLGTEVRQNHGYMSRIDVVLPAATISNPDRPAAVLSRHMAVQRLTDVLFRALSEIQPERAVASSHVSFPTLLARTVDPRTGDERTLMDTVGGGGGARRGAAGDDGIDSYTSNCALISAEVIEIEYPWRVRASSFVSGSGGSGRWRGGRAVHRDYELLATAATVRIAAEQRQPAHAPEGVRGGGPGSPASVSIRRRGNEVWEPLPLGVTAAHLSRGDIVRLAAAGGGGYGPTARPSADTKRSNGP